MTSNIIHIVALGVGFKCPHKIHLNTQWGGGSGNSPKSRFRWIIQPYSNLRGQIMPTTILRPHLPRFFKPSHDPAMDYVRFVMANE